MKKLVACLSFLMLISLIGMAQDQEQDQDQAHFKIKGQVMDTESQQPLVGCHVFVDDKFGTVSRENGMFTLSVPASFMGDNLYFSHIGFETNSKALTELVKGFAAIDMKTAAIMLEEVVIVGDPWSDFRDVITDLSALYPNKSDFMNAILKELEKVDPRLALAIPENEPPY